MSKLTKILACAVVLLGASAAQAVTLNVVGGRLLGATDVLVNGALYNVYFGDLSCIDHFDGCDSNSDFAFTSIGDANAAAQALLDTVFVDGVLGNFDSDPAATFGCGNSDFCLAGVPYEINGTTIEVEAADNRAIEALDTVISIAGGFPQGLSLGNDSNNFNTAVFAIFSPVPEPGAATLFLIGSTLVFTAARRRS
jgi:hypothetical protein